MSTWYVLNPDHSVTREDLIPAARAFEKTDRNVAKTNVLDKAKVSTVFLGLDHSFDDGPPLIFETLVFGGRIDGEMERYSTWDQAVAGHEAMVARVREHEEGC